MKLSIFTPVHKTSKFFELMIKSILDQNYQDWEWIILDNSSSFYIKDFVTYIVKQYIPDNYEIYLDKIKIYEKRVDNKTIAKLKDIAANLCTSEYIIEADYDDVFNVSCLDYINQCIEKTRPDFIYTDWMNIQWNQENNDWCTRNGVTAVDEAFFTMNNSTKHVKVFANTLNYNLICDQRFVPIHLRIWNKEFYYKINGFDHSLKYYDDVDLVYKTLLNTDKIQRLSYPCVSINYHDENTTKDHLSASDFNATVELVWNRYAKDLENLFKSKHQLNERFIPNAK